MSCHSAAIMLWLVLGTKTTWFGLGQHHFLGYDIWFGHHTQSWRCPVVTLKTTTFVFTCTAENVQRSCEIRRVFSSQTQVSISKGLIRMNFSILHKGSWRCPKVFLKTILFCPHKKGVEMFRSLVKSTCSCLHKHSWKCSEFWLNSPGFLITNMAQYFPRSP